MAKKGYYDSGGAAKAGWRTRRAKQQLERKVASMAKKKTAKKDINKSKLIREYKAAHPIAMPKAIADVLTKKHGVEFKASQVSTVLFNANKKSGGRTAKIPGKKPTKKKVASKGGSMTSAAELVKSAGSFAEARKALDELEEVAKLLR